MAEKPIPSEIQGPQDTDAFNSALPSNITAQNAMEFSQAFRKAAGEARGRVEAARMAGQPGTEAGFTVNKNGVPSKVQFGSAGVDEKDVLGSLHQTIASDDVAALHIHRRGASGLPSGQDIETAKKVRKPIYISGQDGLYQVDAMGKVHQVFDSPDWMNEKSKKAPPAFSGTAAASSPSVKQLRRTTRARSGVRNSSPLNARAVPIPNVSTAAKPQVLPVAEKTNSDEPTRRLTGKDFLSDYRTKHPKQKT
jgi:hypothetical protein